MALNFILIKCFPKKVKKNLLPAGQLEPAVLGADSALGPGPGGLHRGQAGRGNKGPGLHKGQAEAGGLLSLSQTLLCYSESKPLWTLSVLCCSRVSAL